MEYSTIRARVPKADLWLAKLAAQAQGVTLTELVRKLLTKEANRLRKRIHQHGSIKGATNG